MNSIHHDKRVAREGLNRNLCGARARSGNPCRRPAGWGSEHPGYGTCKLHGGSTPNGGKAAAKLEAAYQAERIRVLLGLPLKVDPVQALADCLAITVGEVEYCSRRIALLSTETELALAVPSRQVQYWIYARHAAIDRMARYAKLAIDAGVMEHQVRNAEHLGGVVGRLVRDVFNELDLNPEQVAKAAEVVPRHLAVAAVDLTRLSD